MFTIVGKIRRDEESFFGPSRRRRQVDEETFTPRFLDDLEVTDDVAMTCEGNIQCIFDLTATGDLEVAMNTLHEEREANMTRETISEASPTILVAVSLII